MAVPVACTRFSDNYELKEELGKSNTITEDDFQKYMKEFFEDNQNEGNYDDIWSGDEEQNISEDTHNSDSEQEWDAEDLYTEIDNLVGEYYIGRDKKTMWKKTNYKNRKNLMNKVLKINPGPRDTAMNVKSEGEAFFKLIDESIIDEIVRCTNLYIDRKREDVNYSRERDGKYTSRSEIVALLGLLFLIGTKKERHSNIIDLWTSDGTGMPILRACMSYKRFGFLLRCLRFDDLITRDDRKKIDNLAPIRFIFDSIINNFKNCYNHSGFVNIDKKIISYQGNCSFLQHVISNKRTNLGIKIFIVCDSKTFYTSNIEVHCGQQPQGPYFLSNDTNDIVKRLVEHIKGSGRNITVDNYFTSYRLVSDLFRNKLTLISSIKKTEREIPTAFLPNCSKKIGSSLFAFQEIVTLVSHISRKSKAVILLSSLHPQGEIHHQSKKPQIIHDYNLTKIAVKFTDQLSNQYSVSRTTGRWPLALFFTLLNISGINAQIIYNANESNTHHTRRNFLKSLSIQLMKPHLQERTKITVLPTDQQLFLKRFFDECNERQNLDEPRKKRGRCLLCGRQKNKFTYLKCDNCYNLVCKQHSTTVTVCELCENGVLQKDDQD